MRTVSHKRLSTPGETEKIRKRLAAGESMTSIAEGLGISRQRVYYVLNRPNPDGKMKTYRCKRCGNSWRTNSQFKPERCSPKTGCGSYRWDDDE